MARALLALYGRSGADLGYQVWGKATGGLADIGLRRHSPSRPCAGPVWSAAKLTATANAASSTRLRFFLVISPVRQGMAGAPVLRGAREEVLT